MRRELIRPGWIVLVLVVLWGIAGKLDEPPDGFDPEPMATTSVAVGENSAFPSIHLLCYLDEVPGGRNSEQPTVLLLAAHHQPAQHGVDVDSTGPSRRLQCVVADK